MSSGNTSEIIHRITEGLSLDAFSDRDMLLEGIEATAEGMISEETLNTKGREVIIEYLRTNLERLIAIRADRKKHPEIAQVAIKKPVFIMGAPRAGTTFLHNLLAQDPENRSPLGWEVACPSPPPETDSYDTDPRIQQWIEANSGNNGDDFRSQSGEESSKKHDFGALNAEECGFLLAASMRGNDIWALFRGMRYMHWMLYCNMEPAYRIHKEWLQHLQWHAPRERWILKNPPHTLFLNALHSVYPNARLVQNHRDPASVVSSLASLIETYRKAALTHIDRHALGVEALHILELYLMRAHQWRQANPDIPVFDVSYKALTTDTIGVVRHLYAFHNIPFNINAEKRMQAHIDANPRHKKQAHTHQLQDYGLNQQIVYEKLDTYLSAYANWL